MDRGAAHRTTAFELQSPLGAGATAQAWLARDRHGRNLVLKIGHGAASAVALAAEAMPGALALSPRLPELVDLGLIECRGSRARLCDHGSPFLAFTWREGAALPALLENQAPDEQLARVVTSGVGAALADLHELGLCHGDVKPDNVLVGPADAGLIDLGFAGDAYSLAGSAGTVRYLGRGDRHLGDGRARDLLALGIVLAELLDQEVAAAAEPISAARRATLPGPIGNIARALLSPDPGARPTARWVCAMAGAQQESADRHRRWLRGTYLRLRTGEIASAQACAGTASWLERAIDLGSRARAMCRAFELPPPPLVGHGAGAPLGPLEPERRLRWLASLVGPAAAGWPLSAVSRGSEPELAEALGRLCERSPRAWTLRQVEAALAGENHPVSEVAAMTDREPDRERISRLALAVARTPPDAAAIELVERHAAELPDGLVVRAADALRLGGELGRARALLACHAAGDAVLADILRRAGEPDAARAAAERAMMRDCDPDGRARACLARIDLDAGQPASALARVASPRQPAEHEVAALALAQLGRADEALGIAERGYALALDEESRARLSATIAFVRHQADPFGARRRFAAAARHAESAGAVLEEATYRTGEAAASVDLGELEPAEAAARRAALLFDDVLGRPAQAARAWLARAAVYAALDAALETVGAAHEAIVRARAAGDARAEAHACWAIADALPPGDARAADAARAAASLVHASVNKLDDDGLQAYGALLRHDPSLVQDVVMLDEVSAQRGEEARLSWWTARAERLLSTPEPASARRALGELARISGERAPVAARGKAMHVAARLAAALGDSAQCERASAARRAAAEAVWPHVGTVLAEAARSCRWLEVREERPLPADLHVDLQQLVRALGERGDLDGLLAKVVDVLILWTGAERGLFLLRKKDGSLAPRAPRNLDRRDLRGEQLAFSRSLAERALAQGEPVVAVDAMAELSASHKSVHALELRSVLVLPLAARGKVMGVVYLDDRFRKGAFGERELQRAQTVSPIAAIAVADTRQQIALRRAVARAERYGSELADALAHKESALAVAETELARATRARKSRFSYDDIVGQSEAMDKMLQLCDRITASDVPVLLSGESGSGKELVGRAIHRHSSRSGRPFVSENCGALPETLLESALFGHVRGAFTGAHQPRLGLFESADGGTLFLDEVGEMSLAMQTKLLRVIEDGIVRPLGSERSRKVDVRVIAATHRDLESMVAARSFREDLYYRLNVITLRIPPLRERAGDVPLLVEHLIGKHAQGRRVKVSPAAKRALIAYRWPGNVRQLENEVRRALLLCEGTIEVEHLSIPIDSSSDADLGFDLRSRVDNLQRELVKTALASSHGNQTRAAKLLGLSRFGLHKLMKRLDIPK